jgi:hypothetical protein
MIAEDIGHRVLAEDALRRISDLDPSIVEALTPKLVFETVFGSNETAVAVARQTYESALALDDIGVRLLTHSNVVFALMRCGEIDLGIKYAAAVYNFAKEHRAWSTCATCSCLIAESHWFVGDPTQAQAWLDRANESVSRSAGGDRGFQQASLTIMMALDRGDPDSAQRTLDWAEHEFPRLRTHRMAIAGKAFRVRINLHRGNPPGFQELGELIEGYKDHRDHGTGDLVVDTLIAALIRVGRENEASEIRHDYLTCHRKDRFPVARSYSHLRN